MTNIQLTQFTNLSDGTITYGFRIYNDHGNNSYCNMYTNIERLSNETLETLLEIIKSDYSDFYDDIKYDKQLNINGNNISIEKYKNLIVRIDDFMKK